MKTYRKYARTFDIATEQRICEDARAGLRLKALAGKYASNETVIYRVLKAYGVPTTRKVLHYKEDVFDVIDTELKAYVLGLLTSDGYIVNDTSRTRYVVALGSTDKEIPQAFARLIEFSGTLYQIKAATTKGRLLDEWRIMVGSKRLVEALGRLGVFNRKSLRETFCPNVPHALLRHYIRGIYDGDGSLGIYASSSKKSRDARIGLVGSSSLLRSVAEVFTDEIGLPAKEPIVKSGKLYKLEYSGNNLAQAAIRWLYSGHAYALPRKEKIAKEILGFTARHWTKTNYGRQK